VEGLVPPRILLQRLDTGAWLNRVDNKDSGCRLLVAGVRCATLMAARRLIAIPDARALFAMHLTKGARSDRR
jgi:hypothetical protein